MRQNAAWNEVTKIEPEFLHLEERVLSGQIKSYKDIPPQAFSLHGWDMISAQRLFTLVQPFLVEQLARAKTAMPQIYGESLKAIDPRQITTPESWYEVPLLVKDDDPENELIGFRHSVNTQPTLMKPIDVHDAMASFGSGGSMGKYTPTFVTRTDREREIQGWRRGHDYHGLTEGDVALYTYNTTHKGGQWMQESLMAHGVNVLLRRPEEDARKVLDLMRDYKANALFTVQQPLEAMQTQAKAAGINLHDLITTSLEHPEYEGILIPDSKGRKQVQLVFLGGFEIVPYALELSRDCLDNTSIVTLLGSSEAIPQACSTNPTLTPTGNCHYNNLHLLHGPHYIELVKRQGKSWVPVEEGEEGFLVYTSFARDGTLWMRYWPGDVATLAKKENTCPCGIYSPVITNIHRKDESEQKHLLVNGCAAG